MCITNAAEMENPCFQDSDQSMYESTFGIWRQAAMSHPRRPINIGNFNHAHPHASIITHTHGPPYHGLAVSHANTISHAHGIPATAHLHGGRVVGVTGMANSAHTSPVGTPQSIAALLAATSPQPLYSCQAPRGHDHVYQCPGLRGDPMDHHHSNASQLRVDPRLEHHHIRQLEHICDNRMDIQRYNLDHRDQVPEDVKELRTASAADHRTEYHYGGSDYSSTEPIYAQPHLQGQEGAPSPDTTPPPLAYTTMRGSLRPPSTQLHGTPARFLVRTDSTGASTSSSTLPTVSALMSMDNSHSRARTLTHGFSKTATVSSVSSTPAKLKGNGVLGVWKAKCLEGAGGGRRAFLLLGLLVLLLVLVLGGLAAVLYLTLGGGFGALVGQTPQLVHLMEKGSNVVTGQFRITNQNFWHGLADHTSESFRILSQSIEKEVDTLFLNSVWSREFNRTEVVGLSEGSLLVRAKLHLNTPDAAAAKKLGSAFLRGLHKRHSQEWLGPYTIDITSIRFAEVLVDSTETIQSTAPQPPFSYAWPPSSSTTLNPETLLSTRRPNVGWGEWGAWSSCSPCSPQYDQIRTRKCYLDGGRGVLVNNIELCLPEGHGGHGGHMEGARGNMESRSCRCEPDEGEDVEAEQQQFMEVIAKVGEEDALEEETTASKAKVAPTTKLDDGGAFKLRDVGVLSTLSGSKTAKKDEDSLKMRLCEKCDSGEVCVALGGHLRPSCHPEKDPGDPTGCGGLCILNSEVCQALGSRAFQCHSASQCLTDEWKCSDGLCIPQTKRCDGHLNCYDRSDEVMCKCNRDEFHCGNQTSCIPLSARCDGNVDCWDGLDEANCSNGTAGDATQVASSATGGPRVGISPMNRTAIGLSSLSNRERELLS